MELGLDRKTAVVTGASRGVGLATVHALRDEGVAVVGAARTITPELLASGAVPVAVDLSTEVGATLLIDRALAELGGVDLVVNNVGGGEVDLGGLLDLSEQHWRDHFDINLFAALRVSRAALPTLIQRGGAIVNVSSIGAWQPAGPPLPYNVAKAALKALSKGARGWLTSSAPAGSASPPCLPDPFARQCGRARTVSEASSRRPPESLRPTSSRRSRR